MGMLASRVFRGPEKKGLVKNVFFIKKIGQLHFQGPWKNWGWLNLLHLQELIVWDCKNIWIGYIRKTCWNCLHVELILWVGIWARTRPSCLLWWHWSTESGLFWIFHCTRNLDQNCNKKKLSHLATFDCDDWLVFS